MKLPLVILGLLCSGAASAQYIREYIFFAPGNENPGTVQGTSSGFVPPPIFNSPGTSGSQAVYGGGGGVELRLAERIGIAGEVSGLVNSRVPADSLGNLSLNPIVHFTRRDSNIDPYLMAGYSVIFRDFAANGFNAGGGLNYWFRERTGLVVGVTWVHEFATSQNLVTNFVMGRIGLTFR